MEIVYFNRNWQCKIMWFSMSEFLLQTEIVTKTTIFSHFFNEFLFIFVSHQHVNNKFNSSLSLSTSTEFAWVTLATNDSYALGALVVAYSLKKVNTAHQLVVLITPGVTQSMREKLRTVFNLVQEVNVLDSKDAANLALLSRPELGITFTKLHCWRLTQYEKCVFLDADTLVCSYTNRFLWSHETLNNNKIIELNRRCCKIATNYLNVRNYRLLQM